MSFLHLCNQIITIERFLGTNNYGEPTFSPPHRYAARVYGKTQIVKGGQGEERVSRVAVCIATSETFDGRDRITLPSGWSPSQPKIVACSPVRGGAGAHHVEVLC